MLLTYQRVVDYYFYNRLRTYADIRQLVINLTTKNMLAYGKYHDLRYMSKFDSAEYPSLEILP